MRICRTKDEIRDYLGFVREQSRSVGLVPTMGALHRGHESLIRASAAENDVTVVSIFVNPTQFGPNEDFTKYPRQLEEDSLLCEKAGADAIFAPEPAEMYPPDFSTFVEETSLSRPLCGVSRPTHFRGVTTVVAKLLNIVEPDRAYFGRKDAQQALVVKRMVRDLDIPVEIVVVPIVRESDGLAISSRNKYLPADQSEEAVILSRALKAAEKTFSMGQRSAAVLADLVRKTIGTAPHARIDYVEVVDAESLQPVGEITRPALLAIAVFIGETRLIDNTVLSP